MSVQQRAVRFTISQLLLGIAVVALALKVFLLSGTLSQIAWALAILVLAGSLFGVWLCNRHPKTLAWIVAGAFVILLADLLIPRPFSRREMPIFLTDWLPFLPFEIVGLNDFVWHRRKYGHGDDGLALALWLLVAIATSIPIIRKWTRRDGQIGCDGKS